MAALIAAEVPALPLHTAGKYVAGAYIVLFVLVLIYVAVMAIRMSRLERDLGDLLARAQERGAEQTPAHDAGAGAGAQDAASLAQEREARAEEREAV